MRMTINYIAAQVRAARHRNGWAGRLACVTAPCTACDADRGQPCTPIDWGHDLTSVIHAARAVDAANLIERAP